jgi:glucosylceramidase
MITAAQNPDGSIAVVVLNMNEEAKSITLKLGEKSTNLQLSAQAIQTIIIQKEDKA